MNTKGRSECPKVDYKLYEIQDSFAPAQLLLVTITLLAQRLMAQLSDLFSSIES